MNNADASILSECENSVNAPKIYWWGEIDSTKRENASNACNEDIESADTETNRVFG